MLTFEFEKDTGVVISTEADRNLDLAKEEVERGRESEIAGEGDNLSSNGGPGIKVNSNALNLHKNSAETQPIKKF
jgi:hypothetical protein